MEPRNEIYSIALTCGICAGVIVGTMIIQARRIVRRLDEISRKLSAASRPSIADPATAFRTLDDK